MCGLVGYIASKKVADGSTLEQMVGKISHRGPDGTGFWYDNDSGAALAHARLAIIELSPAGHQPMLSACSRYVIAFNGEIYNHLELRHMLTAEDKAPHWNGHSDTETLLACFSAWGIEKTLKATVGMFAIALWDKQFRQLTLARDRVGEKPLYWGWQNGTLLFGSELKALKAHPNFSADIDRQALTLLLRHNYIPAPFSIYQGIYKLPAGHFVTISAESSSSGLTENKPVAYWSYSDVLSKGALSPYQGNEKNAIDELESHIANSVRGQMISDVPLGAFLSGGVDSSIVVAMMQRVTERPVKTFAIGFEEEKYNEAPFAAAVAKHLGTEHTELYISENDALQLVPRLPEIYCEPFADSSQLPTIMVTKMAREGVKVALSGDGGDELFGGYSPYQNVPRYWNSVRHIPFLFRSQLAKNAHLFPNKLMKLFDCMDTTDRERFYLNSISHWNNPQTVVISGTEPVTAFSDKLSWNKYGGFTEWMMAVDAQVYMPDDILVKVDRAAMSNSLETRVPLLDHRVIEFASSLPLEMKIRNGVGKHILRELLYRHVPRDLIERPKKGFSVPLASWLRGPLREWAESQLAESRIQQEGFLNAKQIRACWQEHLSGRRDNARKLWGILMFQAWLESQH